MPIDKFAPVLRIMKARPKTGHEAALASALAEVSAHIRRNHRGLNCWSARGSGPGGEAEMVLVTVWRDFPALQAYFGADWCTVTVSQNMSELIESCSVEHFSLEDAHGTKPCPE